jgi:hypothetical protein
VFTGVACSRDLLLDLGDRIPEDVGLATFSILDGNADAGIDQNSSEIGKAAVQLLISLMHHHGLGIPEVCREVRVEGRWQDGSMLPLAMEVSHEHAGHECEGAHHPPQHPSPPRKKSPAVLLKLL